MGLLRSMLLQIKKALAPEGTSPADLPIYTPRAQQVLRLAREEASRLNQNCADTGHVLLGLIRLGQGVAVNVLKRQGLDLEKTRTAVERLVGQDRQPEANVSAEFTPPVKEVLAAAYMEARALYHTYVGTEHILLGLLGERDGAAARVLKALTST